MATLDLNECYQFLLQITSEAGKIVEEGFYGIKNVETKSNPYDLVTEYDKKTEEFLISNIKQKYPDHVCIGEEDSSDKNVKPVLTDVPTWIIDPIDGTTNFVHSLPIIGISVGLAVNKEVVVGVVHNPITNQQFSAIKGKGAFMNGKPIHTSKVEDLQHAIVANDITHARAPIVRERTLERAAKVIEKASGVRCLGSAAMGLCYLANGSVDVYYSDHLQCWDVAGGAIILKEAGGVIYNADGTEFDMFARNLSAAANEKISKEILDILKQCDAKTKMSKK